MKGLALDFFWKMRSLTVPGLNPIRGNRSVPRALGGRLRIDIWLNLCRTQNKNPKSRLIVVKNLLKPAQFGQAKYINKITTIFMTCFTGPIIWYLADNGNEGITKCRVFHSNVSQTWTNRFSLMCFPHIIWTIYSHSDNPTVFFETSDTDLY